MVDDEKVAEGLRQLRSWYQGDTPDANPPEGAPPAPAGSGARPTAVGHATAPPAAVVAQRPMAPDPMRATMYGHDVHRFDLDTTPPAGGAAPPPVQSSTALVVASPGRQQEIYQPQAEAVPRPVARSGSDPFPLARFGHGEAERLQRPARASGTYQPPVRPVSGAQVASRIMFGVGLVALIAAAIFWYQAGGPQDAPAATPPAQAASPPQPSLPVPTTPAPVAPAPERTATPAPSPERPAATANPAPIPAAQVALPKTVRLRLPGQQPDPERPVRRRQPPKPVAVEPTETDEAATPIAPPVADKQPKEAVEPKEIKARASDAEPRQVKAAKEIKEATAPKEPKEAMAPKEPKEIREATAPKEPREVREVKEPKLRKEPKVRSTDNDATLPPSVE